MLIKTQRSIIQYLINAEEDIPNISEPSADVQTISVPSPIEMQLIELKEENAKLLLKLETISNELIESNKIIDSFKKENDGLKLENTNLKQSFEYKVSIHYTIYVFHKFLN